MAQNPSSVFDSLVESDVPAAPDARIAEWLVRRLLVLREPGLRQLVDDMRAHDMSRLLDGWLAGRLQPLDPAQFALLEQAGGVFETSGIDAFAAQQQLDRGELRAQLARLVPGLVQALMPRGEVPSWRALELGLNSLQKSLHAAAK